MNVSSVEKQKQELVSNAKNLTVISIIIHNAPEKEKFTWNN
jgi:hypothetical protein